jgi:hypothetical protein
MSWLFSRALEAEFSVATCSAGGLSAPSSVMPTPHPFWWRDRTMDFSQRSPFGQTLPVSTADHGEALLTWFREASRARTSALPAKEPVSMAHALDSGARWRALLAKFDPESSSWKTAQHSFFADSGELFQTWPRSGMTAGGQCWELPMSERRTRETASGSWPTPLTSDARGPGPSATRQGGQCLSVAVKLWPTPTANQYECKDLDKMLKRRERAKASSGNGNGFGLTLANAVRLPTPSTIGINGESNSRRIAQRRGDATSAELNGGSLNPPWVEWLMGWPLGWTDLEPSATDKSHSAPQPLSESSQEAETA